MGSCVLRRTRRRPPFSSALLVALALAGCKPASTIDLDDPALAVRQLDDPFLPPGTVQLRVQPSLAAPLTADNDVTLMTTGIEIATAPYRADATIPLDVPNNVGDMAALALAFFRQGDESPFSLGRSVQFGKSSKQASVFVGVINQFSAAPSQPTINRWGATATPLADGTVLIAGGATGGTDAAPAATDALDLYNPATGVFTPLVADGFGARVYHTAVVDQDGNVVFMGGLDENDNPRSDVVVFERPRTRCRRAIRCPSRASATSRRCSRSRATPAPSSSPAARSPAHRRRAPGSIAPARRRNRWRCRRSTPSPR